jgi:hypothetical protein
MAGKRLKWWFDAVCTILVLAGVVFASFGLDILPVERSVLLKWGSGIYRSLMMGWGTTLLLTGQVAFRKGDRELVRALAVGLSVWLLAEAVCSMYWRVWFNVGVDMIVLALFLVTLSWKLRKSTLCTTYGA